MNKHYNLSIALITMFIFVKMHPCYAQEIIETTTHFTISVVANSTGKPIAGAEVRMEGSDGSTQTDSTTKSGFASFSAMRKNVLYNIQVASPSYYTERTKLFLTDTISTQHVEFSMMKIPCLGNPLPQLVFKRNSIRFTENSDKDLETMVFILKENPDFTIAISGHTAPHEKEKTGLRRAEKVREIIINHGIDADRISIDTTQQCETDCEGIEYISHCDFRGKVITKAYLKTLSKKERRLAKRSCMQVRFRISGNEFDGKHQ